ncbi:unnamed protein product [Aphanomyces euteiches]
MFGVQAERILTTCRHAATGNSTPCVNDTIQGKTIDLPFTTGWTEGYFTYDFSHLELTSIETWPSMPTFLDFSSNNLTNLQVAASDFPHFDDYVGIIDLRGNPNIVLTVDSGVYSRLNNDKFYLAMDEPSNSTAALKACRGDQSFVRPIQTFVLHYESDGQSYGHDLDWKLVDICCLGCSTPYTLAHTFPTQMVPAITSTVAPTAAPTIASTPALAIGTKDSGSKTTVTVVVVVASIAVVAFLVYFAKKTIDKRRRTQNATPKTTDQAAYVEQL